MSGPSGISLGAAVSWPSEMSDPPPVIRDALGSLVPSPSALAPPMRGMFSGHCLEFIDSVNSLSNRVEENTSSTLMSMLAFVYEDAPGTFFRSDLLPAQGTRSIVKLSTNISMASFTPAGPSEYRLSLSRTDPSSFGRLR